MFVKRGGQLEVAFACGDDRLSAPCPKPPGFLVPAAETIPVGGFGTFAIPVDLQNMNRSLQWTVGPMTVAMLMKNTVRAHRQNSGEA